MYPRAPLRRLVFCLGISVVASGVAQASPNHRGFVAQTHHVVVARASIAYYERGSGSPLVMLIGSHSTMSEWDPRLVSGLAAGRRVIMVDYRGVGLSTGKVTDSPAIADMADDTAAFIETLKRKQVDVLGWSMGGMVAQQLTIRHPQLVRKLVLAATNPGGKQAVLGPDRYNEIEDNPDSSETEQLSTLFPRTPNGREEAKAFLKRVEQAADIGEIPNDFKVSKTAYRVQTDAEVRWLGSNSNYGDLGLLRRPTLVSGGQQDVLTPDVNAQRLAHQIGGSETVLYKNGGHAFLFEFSRSFARRVLRFLG